MLGLEDIELETEIDGEDETEIEGELLIELDTEIDGELEIEIEGEDEGELDIEIEGELETDELIEIDGLLDMDELIEIDGLLDMDDDTEDEGEELVIVLPFPLLYKSVISFALNTLVHIPKSSMAPLRYCPGVFSAPKKNIEVLVKEPKPSASSVIFVVSSLPLI